MPIVRVVADGEQELEVSWWFAITEDSCREWDWSGGHRTRVLCFRSGGCGHRRTRGTSRSRHGRWRRDTRLVWSLVWSMCC